MESTAKNQVGPRQAGGARKASQRATGSERRRQIIDAAAAVFSQKGYSGATTKEIAAKAGINEALIFRHFGGKDALHDAVVDAKFEDIGSTELRDKLRAAAERSDDDAVFRTAATILFHRYQSERDVLRILMYGILEQRKFVVERFENELRPLGDFLANYIAARKADGHFTCRDAEIAVFGFIGMVAHHATVGELMRGDRDLPSAEEAARVYSEIFIKSLRNC